MILGSDFNVPGIYIKPRITNTDRYSPRITPGSMTRGAPGGIATGGYKKPSYYEHVRFKGTIFLPSS